METTETKTDTTHSSEPETETVSQQMRDKYDDKGKLVVTNLDQMDDFQAFVGTFDESDPILDWTKKVPEDGSFTAFAVVRTDSEKNRMIAMPSKEAFTGNLNALNWAYQRFLRHILNVAASDDASESQFVVVDGCIKAKYDLTAFKAQAMQAVKWLRKQGLQGMTVPGLKSALSSSAFALSQFPRAKKANWESLLARMIAIAEQKGHDTSLFAYWQATREAKVDTGEEIDFNLDDFSLESEDDATETAQSASQPTTTA